jgi:hypothetical protein
MLQANPGRYYATVAEGFTVQLIDELARRAD